MNKPSKLCYRRLMTAWKYNYSVWKSTIDWTVALYLVLPALVLGIDQYIKWWKTPPQWLSLLPSDIFLISCFLFAWAGSIRMFLEEADQIFLLNQKIWLKQIRKLSLAYSFFVYLLSSILFFILLAPLFLKHYHFSLSHLGNLFFFTLLLKILLGLIKQLIILRYSGWLHSILLRGLMVLCSLFFMSIISDILNNTTVFLFTTLFMIIVLIVLALIRINLISSFLADVALEQSQKLKYVRILLSFSGISIKKTKKRRNRPLLFYNSNLIFNKRTPANGLVELCIKTVLRNSKSLWEYIQIVFACVLVIVSVSGSTKWIIWLVLAFVMVNYVGLYWKEIIISDFVRMLKWEREDKILALQKSLFLVTLPGFLLISIVMGFQTFYWAGAIIVVPISTILLFYTCRIVGFYLHLKNYI